MEKCYIQACDYEPADVPANAHIRRGVVYLNELGQSSCWVHERGYYLGEIVETVKR